MPELILSNDEHASHEQLTLTTTSDATANGIDTNSATARLSRHGQPLSGHELHFTLSGDARFIQGGQRATATTDIRGEARVAFTDIRQETVLVTCHYRQTQVSENSRFNEPATAVSGISAAILQNGAQANGVAENRMRYIVYGVSGTGIPNVGLDFSTTGSATLSAQQGLTDSNGYYTLALSNLVPEQVVVSASVQGSVGMDNHTYVYFTPASLQYRIIVSILSSYSPVNQNNTITYSVYRNSTNQPVSGILLNYDIPPQVQYTPGGVTNAQGMTTLTMISNLAGAYRIRASIATEPLSINLTSMMWRGTL